MIQEDLHMEDTHKFLPLEETKKDDIQFTGLSKEETMLYANDPKWVKIRWALFFLFWLIWIGLLVSAILIVVFTPKCPYKPKQTWWEKDIIYQLDVAVFKDSDGDGVGDLKGVLDNLDYLKDIGVRTICLRDNIIDQSKPKSILPQFEKEKIKDFSKILKANDMHTILDIPYKILYSNDNKNESKEIIRHWLKSYVDGIRITNLPENADPTLSSEWNLLAKQIAEETFEKKYIAYYPFKPNQLVDKAKPNTLINDLLNNLLEGKFDEKKKTEIFNSIIEFYNKTDSKNLWPSFITGHYDNTVRINDLQQLRGIANIFQCLFLLLKGTPYVLYGDELGFNAGNPLDNKYMRWDDSVNCGFSTNETLMIKNCKKSVQSSLAYGAEKRLVRLYKDISKLRQEPSFAWGEIKFGGQNKKNKTENKNIISFVREAVGFDGYLVAANLIKEETVVNFKDLHDIAIMGTVEFFYSEDQKFNSDFNTGSSLHTDKISLKVGELIVIKFSRNPIPDNSNAKSKSMH